MSGHPPDLSGEAADEGVRLRRSPGREHITRNRVGPGWRVLHRDTGSRLPRRGLRPLRGGGICQRGDRTPGSGTLQLREGVSGADAAISNPGVEVVVIATPHDTEADLAARALAARKHCAAVYADPAHAWTEARE